MKTQINLADTGPDTPGLRAASGASDVVFAQRNALLEAFGQVSEGLVICDVDGKAAYESSSLSQLAHIEGSAAAQAVSEVLDSALRGNRNVRSLELHGTSYSSFNLSGVPVLDEDNVPIGAVAVLLNSTERRHSQALLSEFVADVSHELKTPVGAISLLADALELDRNGDTADRLIERIQIETERLARTIDELINMSRLDARASVSNDQLIARNLVGAAMSRVRYFSESRRISVTTDFIGEPSIYGNSADLVSATCHVLENAVKYSNDDSSIEIRCEQENNWTEISVTDHGPGIAPKYLGRIFERFYRAGDATKKTGGTGLGLAIVRQVVQQHCGEVRVESQEGEGSTFTLRLPATPSILKDRLVIEGGTDG